VYSSHVYPQNECVNPFHVYLEDECWYSLHVIVPPEGDLEFRWDSESEMCWCFIHVMIELISGTTQRSVIESCITHFCCSPRETVRGARQAEGRQPRSHRAPTGSDQNKGPEDSVKRGGA